MNEKDMSTMAITHIPMDRMNCEPEIKHINNNESDTEIHNKLNDTYFYNQDPICLFNWKECFGYSLPIIPSYADKTKLE